MILKAPSEYLEAACHALLNGNVPLRDEMIRLAMKAEAGYRRLLELWPEDSETVH